MAQTYRTADDVANMEQELIELRMRLEQTSRSLELVTNERNRMQIENAMMEGRTREMLIKSTRVEALLQNVAHMIVSGLREFKEEREQQRAMRRQEQETQMAEENRQDPPPAFLRSDPPRQQKSIGMTEKEGQMARAEQLRGAAERIADRHDVLPRRPADVSMPPVQPTMGPRPQVSRASLDSRIPSLQFRTAEDDDRDNLRDIATSLERR